MRHRTGSEVMQRIEAGGRNDYSTKVVIACCASRVA